MLVKKGWSFEQLTKVKVYHFMQKVKKQEIIKPEEVGKLFWFEPYLLLGKN